MAQDMLVRSSLFDSANIVGNVGRPKQVEEAAALAESGKTGIKIRIKIKIADLEKIDRLYSKQTSFTDQIGKGKLVGSTAAAINCGKLRPPMADLTRVMKSKKENSVSSGGIGRGSAVYCGKLCAETAKPMAPSLPVLKTQNPDPERECLLEAKLGPERECLLEAKYREKFEASKRKFVDLSKRIEGSRKKIKLIDFKDVPVESRLAASETKKLIKPKYGRCRV